MSEMGNWEELELKLRKRGKWLELELGGPEKDYAGDLVYVARQRLTLNLEWIKGLGELPESFDLSYQTSRLEKLMGLEPGQDLQLFPTPLGGQPQLMITLLGELSTLQRALTGALGVEDSD